MAFGEGVEEEGLNFIYVVFQWELDYGPVSI